VDLDQLRAADGAHPGALVRDHDHELLRLQDPESFSHRSAAHAELPAKHVLRQVRARRVLPVEDLPLQAESELVREPRRQDRFPLDSDFSHLRSSVDGPWRALNPWIQSAFYPSSPRAVKDLSPQRGGDRQGFRLTALRDCGYRLRQSLNRS